jgi:hypothetical protein
LPELPKEGRATWATFLELHQTRSSGMGIGAITYTEIDAWQRVTGIDLDPWEIVAIKALDVEFIQIASESNG